MGYGQIPMVALWTVLEDYVPANGGPADGWRKVKKAAGAPVLEDLISSKKLSPSAALQRHNKHIEMPPLELPVILDRLWNGNSSCVSSTVMWRLPAAFSEPRRCTS